MDWDLENIRTLMRQLIGRQDTTVVTNATLNDKINAFYQYQFADEVDVHEFRGFTTFDTAAGTETYDVPESVLSAELPFQITDSDDVVYDLDFYSDVGVFKDIYPDDAHDEADERDRPSGILMMGRVFYLRPVPDAVYTVKYPRKSTLPTALSGDSDTPDDEKWGPMLAYGPAIEYLQQMGQDAEADSLKDLYDFYRSSVARKQLRQYMLGRRAAPRW
jgi:hypothetical protein